MCCILVPSSISRSPFLTDQHLLELLAILPYDWRMVVSVALGGCRRDQSILLYSHLGCQQGLLLNIVNSHNVWHAVLSAHQYHACNTNTFSFVLVFLCICCPLGLHQRMLSHWSTFFLFPKIIHLGLPPWPVFHIF